VRGIPKEDGALARTGLGSARLQLLRQETRLRVGVGFGGEHANALTTEMEFFLHYSRTCVSLRLIPVRASLLFWASWIGAGGGVRKYASHEA
jgi:hypothetical protein